MKIHLLSIIITFLFISVTVAGYAQQISPEEQAIAYRVKAMKFDNMKGTGSKLMFASGVCFATGVGIIASSNWYTDAYGNTTTDDEKALYGILLIPVSIGLGVAGTIFHIVGRKKSDQYMKRAKEVTIESNSHGVGITLRF